MNFTPAKPHQLATRIGKRPILHLPPAKLIIHERLEPVEFRSLTAALTYAYLNPAQYVLLTPRGSRIELDTLTEGAPNPFQPQGASS